MLTRKYCYRKEVSNTIKKNEPIVGRNIFHGQRPCKEAELTPWLWKRGRREDRIQQ